MVGWGCFVLKEKLKRLRETLKTWNRTDFGNMDEKIKVFREELQALDARDDEAGLEERDVIRRKEVAANLLLQLNNRKSLLSQKAKIRWIREGDVNSKVFHKAINCRRFRNGLTGIEVGGEWVEEPGGVKEAVREHFRTQFQSRGMFRVEMPTNLDENKLDEGDGESLTREFSENKIKEAIWECDGSKSPGPDGFNMEFYKSCWDIVKGDVMRMMVEFHAHGKLVRGCNSSFIVLIPKNEGYCNINQFRPISLIGSAYKIVAKVLARRMMRVVSKIIGDEQLAFIKGRYILDGVVVLNELVEDAKKSKERRIFLKVDFVKAYDSIDWEYLIEMLKILNFPSKWICWVKECISTASANVLVNGSPSGEFQLERGIRQGDPLSPFLFLAAAEGLNLLVKKAVKEGLFKAATVGREMVEISHLQYADDTIFSVQGSEENAKALK